MIRSPRIIITNYNSGIDPKILLEKIEDNILLEKAEGKYITDVFKAFPDVSFEVHWGRISFEKAIDIQKKYQNVFFDFFSIKDRTYEAFSRHFE
jgi:predicted TIM-barrel fold metal-dependent hydrolase